MVSKVLIVLCLMATSSFAAVRRGGRGSDRGSQRPSPSPRPVGSDENQSGGSSGGRSGEDKEPLHLEEFEAEIMFLRTHFMAAGVMAGELYNMSSDANDAAVVGNFDVWDNIRHEFDDQMQSVGSQFQHGEERLWELTEKLYTKPGDFKESHTCVVLHNFVQSHSTEDEGFDFNMDTAMGALHAMEADIKCFEYIFKDAENIPDEHSEFWDHTSMEAAFDLVADIYKRVFRVKTAGTRFHKACMAVEMAEQAWSAAHQPTDAPTEMPASAMNKREKSLLKRLLTLLNEEKK